MEDLRRDVEAVGTIFAYEDVTVSSEVEGRVEKVLVDVGDRVVAGQPLVQVLPTELKLTLAQQEAALNQARARLGLRDGEEDLLDVTHAAEVEKAAADLNDARKNYTRAETLQKQGIMARQTFDESEARYKAAQAAYDLAVQGVQNLRGQLAQYKAAVALARKKLADAVIRAPFAGQIRERSVTEGQYLKVQTPVASIVQNDPLRVRVRVPEKWAAWVKVGQPLTVSVEAYPGRNFNGQISRINPAVDQQTRAFEVEALVENHEGLLKPGFFVKALIPSNKVDQALLAPAAAVHYVYGIYNTYVIEGGKLKEREIKIGDRHGEDVEILDGLKLGESVALAEEGQVLKDDAPVTVTN